MGPTTPTLMPKNDVPRQSPADLGPNFTGGDRSWSGRSLKVSNSRPRSDPQGPSTMEGPPTEGRRRGKREGARYAEATTTRPAPATSPPPSQP